MIVALKHVKKAAIALLKEFPFLEEDEQEVVVRLQDVATHDVLIDLMKPMKPHLRAIFKNAKTVEMGKQKYRIPSCEMALALKFAPMISLARQDKKKLVDAHDFIDIVEKNKDLNHDVLASLGDLVYNGGGKEILELVRKVRAGEKLNL